MQNTTVNLIRKISYRKNSSRDRTTRRCILSHKTMQLLGFGAGKFGKVITKFKSSSTTGNVLIEISDDMRKTRSLRASSTRSLQMGK